MPAFLRLPPLLLYTVVVITRTMQKVFEALRMASVPCLWASRTSTAPVLMQLKSTGQTFNLDLALFIAFTWYGPARSMQRWVKGLQDLFFGKSHVCSSKVFLLCVIQNLRSLMNLLAKGLPQSANHQYRPGS